MALPGKSRRQQLREQQLAAARKQKRNRLIVWSSVIVVAALVITGATVAIVRTVGNRPVADMSAVQKFDNIPRGTTHRTDRQLSADPRRWAGGPIAPRG